MTIDTLRPSDQQFLSGLRRIQGRIGRAQQQITSGRRINSVSDSPTELSGLLSLRSELSRVEQITTNLGRVKTEVDRAEQVLGAAVKLGERVRVLGAQGANTTTPAESRRALAGELNVVLEQLVTIANTTVEGRFIFAGDSDQSRPYEIDPTPPNLISTYGGGTATREVLDPSGITFRAAKTADEIFDNADGAKNVFATIRTLRDALEANDEEAIRAALPDVDTAAQHLIEMQSSYGAFQGRVGTALKSAREAGVRVTAQLSEVEDADVAEAILELQQGVRDQEAALQARSRAPRGSLFDYLG